jgi:glucosyl-3-phosphoglycerate phosphatase
VSGRRVVLWRHGQTSWNAVRRAQGQIDVPLDEQGVVQARDSAARLASLRPVEIVTSDLSRATATAAELARLTGLTSVVDPALREIYLGAWQGLTGDQYAERFPEEYRRWREGTDVRRGGGETYAECAERVAASIGRAVERIGPGDTVVLVSHGVSIRVGACRFLDIPQPRWSAFGGLSNCAWVILEEGRRGWRMTEWNAGSLPEPMLSDDVAPDDPEEQELPAAARPAARLR